MLRNSTETYYFENGAQVPSTYNIFDIPAQPIDVRGLAGEIRQSFEYAMTPNRQIHKIFSADDYQDMQLYYEDRDLRRYFKLPSVSEISRREDKVYAKFSKNGEEVIYQVFTRFEVVQSKLFIFENKVIVPSSLIKILKDNQFYIIRHDSTMQLVKTAHQDELIFDLTGEVSVENDVEISELNKNASSSVQSRKRARADDEVLDEERASKVARMEAINEKEERSVIEIDLISSDDDCQEPVEDRAISSNRQEINPHIKSYYFVNGERVPNECHILHHPTRALYLRALDGGVRQSSEFASFPDGRVFKVFSETDYKEMQLYYRDENLNRYLKIPSSSETMCYDGGMYAVFKINNKEVRCQVFTRSQVVQSKQFFFENNDAVDMSVIKKFKNNQFYIVNDDGTEHLVNTPNQDELIYDLTGEMPIEKEINAHQEQVEEKSHSSDSRPLSTTNIQLNGYKIVDQSELHVHIKRGVKSLCMLRFETIDKDHADKLSKLVYKEYKDITNNPPLYYGLNKRVPEGTQGFYKLAKKCFYKNSRTGDYNQLYSNAYLSKTMLVNASTGELVPHDSCIVKSLHLGRGSSKNYFLVNPDGSIGYEVCTKNAYGIKKAREKKKKGLKRTNKSKASEQLSRESQESKVDNVPSTRSALDDFLENQSLVGSVATQGIFSLSANHSAQAVGVSQESVNNAENFSGDLFGFLSEVQGGNEGGDQGQNHTEELFSSNLDLIQNVENFALSASSHPLFGRGSEQANGFDSVAFDLMDFHPSGVDF